MKESCAISSLCFSPAESEDFSFVATRPSRKQRLPEPLEVFLVPKSGPKLEPYLSSTFHCLLAERVSKGLFPPQKSSEIVHDAPCTPFWPRMWCSIGGILTRLGQKSSILLITTASPEVPLTFEMEVSFHPAVFASGERMPHEIRSILLHTNRL